MGACIVQDIQVLWIYLNIAKWQNKINNSGAKMIGNAMLVVTVCYTTIAPVFILYFYMFTTNLSNYWIIFGAIVAFCAGALWYV